MEKTDDFSEEMPFEEKDKFWSVLYEKVSKAVVDKLDFTIVFNIPENGLADPEGYSVIIHKDDYKLFLENFLLWSEENERYEICLEVKEQLKKLEIWKTKN
jgi:hypothetical protein